MVYIPEPQEAPDGPSTPVEVAEEKLEIAVAIAEGDAPGRIPDPDSDYDYVAAATARVAAEGD